MIASCTDTQWGEALHARLGDRRVPLIGQWELTCRCNLQCVMCYTDPFNTPARIRQELSTDEILRILQEIADAGCLELCLTGGEPLARPDFRDIYRAAHARGLLLTVFTNGTLITDDYADFFAQYPPQRIEISLYGDTPATYEGTTQRAGSFDRCLAGIERLRVRGLPVVLKTPAMTLNAHELLAMQAWAQGQGLHYQFGEWMRPRLDGATDTSQWQLDPPALEALERQAGTAWEEHERQQTAERRCGSAQRRFHIDAYGQLQLCSQNRRASYDLRHGSFREGFYEALPTFACPHKRGVQLTTFATAHA